MYCAPTCVVILFLTLLSSQCAAQLSICLSKLYSVAEVDWAAFDDVLEGRCSDGIFKASHVHLSRSPVATYGMLSTTFLLVNCVLNTDGRI